MALFVLGLLLFTPPLLIIFNKPNLSLGVPTLYLYLFAVWITFVALVALAVERPHATGRHCRSWAGNWRHRIGASDRGVN